MSVPAHMLILCHIDGSGELSFNVYVYVFIMPGAHDAMNVL